MKDSYADHLRHQHEDDGGLSARLAIAHEKTATELRNLPETLMPVAPNQYFFAMVGTAEERRAAVDAWAARHHVTATWQLGLGYCAHVPGEITMTAMALPVVTGYAEDVPLRPAEDRAVAEVAA